MLKRIEREESADYGAVLRPTPESEGFDLREAIHFFWREWKLIVAVSMLGLLIGALYLARQTPLYTASAQLLLDPRKDKIAVQDSALTDVAMDLPYIESQIAVIQSTSLLSRVVEKQRLVEDSEFGVHPGDSGGGLVSAVRAFFSRTPPKPAEPTKAAAYADTASVDQLSSEVVATVESLKGAVQVQRSGQALVLSVSFTSADAAKAARLANAVADAYVVDKLDARYEAAKRASAWLSDRLVDLKKKLRESEEAVAEFRAANDLPTSGSAQGGTLTQEQLAQLNGRLVGARAETAEKKARLDQLQKVLTAGGGVGDLPDIANAGAIPELRRQENDLRRQEADLLTRYNERYPAVVNVRAQISDVRRSLAAEAARVASDVKHDYDLSLARQGAVEKALHEVSGQTDLDANKIITLRELERNAAVNKSLFENFLQQSKVTDEQSTFEVRDARVITPALPPGGPSSPKRNRVLLTSLLLGLVVGGAGAYLLELLNAGFTTPRQVEDMLRLPLLASVARMDPRDLAADGAPLTIPQFPLVKPLSRFSESIRSLRSAVQMSDVDNPPRTIMVTSTLPNEGKSTIAMSIAASAAQAGQRTLLIDGDMRHPSTSRYFELDKEPGLVDYLVGEGELAKTTVFSERLRLWVLPAGGKTQNPPDLLASEKFKTLIAALPDQFDLIVIDTPPMGPVADPLIAAQAVDKVIYVVRWASTAREMVQHSIERLTGHKKVAGVVFNQVVESKAQKYGRHAYSYYYGGRYYQRYYSE